MSKACSEPGAEKTFDEEFGWKQIDQLGSATLQFSNHCLEYKKLCIGLITAVPAVLLTVTDHRLDPSIFVAALAIAISFLVVDADAYFYQERIRAQMLLIADGLRAAKNENTAIAGVGMPLRDRRRNPRVRSFFNSSQRIYGILILVDLALWSAYGLHLIA